MPVTQSLRVIAYECPVHLVQGLVYDEEPVCWFGGPECEVEILWGKGGDDVP